MLAFGQVCVATQAWITFGFYPHPNEPVWLFCRFASTNDEFAHVHFLCHWVGTPLKVDLCMLSIGAVIEKIVHQKLIVHILSMTYADQYCRSED